MPYIDRETRYKLDPAINALVDVIITLEDEQPARTVVKRARDHEDKIEGVMNYIVTALLNACMIGYKPRYKKINRAVGVLECVKQEFYRRLAIPYEDEAVEKNGDMPCYHRFFPIQFRKLRRHDDDIMSEISIVWEKTTKSR